VASSWLQLVHAIVLMENYSVVQRVLILKHILASIVGALRKYCVRKAKASATPHALINPLKCKPVIPMNTLLIILKT
jgi:hypothetical protein